MKAYIYVFLLFLISCSNRDNRLSIINTTNRHISYDYEVQELNDTLIDLRKCETTNLYDIKAHSEQTIRSQDKWHFVLDESHILRIYIYDEATVNKLGLCKVYKEYKYLKRFDLTLSNLEKMNWKVKYTE